jgi:hypothetical protein
MSSTPINAFLAKLFYRGRMCYPNVSFGYPPSSREPLLREVVDEGLVEEFFVRNATGWVHGGLDSTPEHWEVRLTPVGKERWELLSLFEKALAFLEADMHFPLEEMELASQLAIEELPAFLATDDDVTRAVALKRLQELTRLGG